MEYYVADTYKNAKRIGEPIKKNGRLYTQIEMTCDRCGGTGVFACRVENGHPVPHPAYGGVCLKCNGEGVVRKTVRLYTEREYAAAQKAKANRKATAEERRIAAERERKAKAFDNWIERNGFDSDGYTYVFYGKTYPIKDDLKAHGCKYSRELSWHGATAVEVPDDCYVDRIHWSDVYDWDITNGIMQLNQRGKDFLNDIFTSHTLGTFVGEPGERLRNIKVIFDKMITFEGKYGEARVYRFNYEGAQLSWFTEKELDLDEGAEYILTGTVKKHDIYGNVRTTYLNRCIVK